MIPGRWFSYSRYGREAADAAFHIVQHGDLAAQVRILPRLKEFAKKGEADRCPSPRCTIGSPIDVTPVFHPVVTEVRR